MRVLLVHSRVKMTSGGGNLHICSINQVLSMSFHKYLCPNDVALSSQCISSTLLRGTGTSEMLYVRRLPAVFSTKKIQTQSILEMISQTLNY